MGQGKACANDRDVIEMIVALNEMVLDELAQCFRLRALDHISEDTDEVWDEHSVALILKEFSPPYIPRTLTTHRSPTLLIQIILRS